MLPYKVHLKPQAMVDITFTVDIATQNGPLPYLVIYGNHINGHFCCILSHGVSCELSEPNDLFYNTEKLQTLFPSDIAQTLARSISDAASSYIMHQPWKTALKLSTRAQNCLARNDHPSRYKGKHLETVGDVAKMTRSEIRTIRNAGPRTFQEVARALQKVGIQSTAWFNFLDEIDDTSPCL